MEPVTLIVGALTTALITAGGNFVGKALEETAKAMGEKLGEGIGGKAAQLLTRIGAKAEEKQDDMAKAALKKITAEPQNERAQKQIALAIDELIAEDEAFKKELVALATELSKSLKPVAGAGNTVTVGNISGNTDSNIVISGGNVTMGDLSTGKNK